MANFYIKRISLTGRQVETASVLFEKGLNIIYGPSNTGKSYIAECIDYMFGSDAKTFRIGSETGYDCVTMLVIYKGDEIHLERHFEDNNIYVYSHNSDIKSGKYTRNKGNANIGDMWLRLMGIDDPPKILANENFRRWALTLRTILHTFLIDEDDIIQTGSIFYKRAGYSKTAILSSLLYFMTNDSLEHYDAREAKSIKDAKRNAIIEYINSSLSNLANRKNDLREQTVPKIEETQGKINSIMDEIYSTEGNLSAAVERSEKLSHEIYEINSKLAESTMLHNRYQALRSQYISDIRRLTFIADGEIHRESHAETTRCPFCDGTLGKEEVESCVEAAGSELRRIQAHLNDLRDAEENIIMEINELNETSNSLKIERTNVEKVIDSKLKPKIHTLRQTLSDYSNSIEVHQETSVIGRFENDMITDLKNYEGEDENEVKYKPRDHFNDQMIGHFNEILDKILDNCGFENYSSSYFSKDTFDVVVNGKAKAKFGKGYRAFLNSVLALTLMEYLATYGVYKPGLLVIDSPILSLKEKTSEKASDSMKKSLFRYMLNNQQNGQTIIIENEIPKLDYTHANLIHFTKDPNIGRYGLLHGITE